MEYKDCVSKSDLYTFLDGIIKAPIKNGYRPVIFIADPVKEKFGIIFGEYKVKVYEELFSSADIRIEFRGGNECTFPEMHIFSDGKISYKE